MGGFIFKNVFRRRANARGSVLIVVIIISSVLFSIGIAFAKILERELLSQVYAQRSIVAFNVANSALECVMYNNFQRGAFSSNHFFSRIDTVDCGSYFHVRSTDSTKWGTTPYGLKDEGTNSQEDKYKFKLVEHTSADLSSVSATPCAYVTVERDCSDGVCSSFVDVRGYALCSANESESQHAADGVRRLRLQF